MRIEQAALGEVVVDELEGAKVPIILEDFTDIAEYSRFKFGEGAAGHKYGFLLGELAITSSPDLLEYRAVYVASSAYRFAPSASESLLAPFVETAQGIADAAGTGTSIIPFKISKKKLATDNYAGMSFAERSRTLQSDLELPAGLSFADKRVIVLDDIRVTGLREEALTKLMSGAAVAATTFLYILDVRDGQHHPETEAVINMNAVKGLDDIIDIACHPGFVPNVRVAKNIAGRTVSEIEHFMASVPVAVAAKITEYIREDNLYEVVRATP